MRALYSDGLLVGRILDYGCGRGTDAKILKDMVRGDVETYDPHFQPDMPNGFFDTITCNFVLNVIPDEDEREAVLLGICLKLRNKGVAYITVRDDKKSLKGWTSKKTWQGLIELGFPIHAKKSGQYVTYKLTK